jgi:hypothetical protein
VNTHNYESPLKRCRLVYCSWIRSRCADNFIARIHCNETRPCHYQLPQTAWIIEHLFGESVICNETKNAGRAYTVYAWEVVTSRLTDWLTDSMEQNPSWEAIITKIVKKFPAFHGTRRIITVFTRARHWNPSWARWIKSTHNPTIFPQDQLYHHLPIYA